MIFKGIFSERYEIKHLIGSGGMSDVYLAYDHILGRDVAIKFLRGDLNDDTTANMRFKREALTAATVIHPNIVEVYDISKEDGRPYIVMEYVVGKTLKQLIHSRGGLYQKEAIYVMKQLTSAVKVAHENDIIHRDIKPQNVLVTDSGTIKVTDFGIAITKDVTQVTKNDTIMGSLHYLAPELAKGQLATVQSDIYALGIVMYELLVGKVPFDAEAPINIAMQHLNDPISSVREVNPTILQSVENIITKATAKNLDVRYKTAEQMLNDLNVCLNPEHAQDEKLVLEYIEKDNDLTRIAPSIMLGNGGFDTVAGKKKKKRMSVTSILMYIFMSVVIFGMVFLGMLLMSNGSNNNRNMVNVPDVLGMSIEEATNVLSEYELSISPIIKYVASEGIEEGKIISTNPVAGREIGKGKEITIVVSLGDYIVINNYVNQTLEGVKAELEAKGMSVVITERYDVLQSGIIIEQSLPEGTKIAPNGSYRDKRIEFVVSKGEEKLLPDFRGMNIEEVRIMCAELGIGLKENPLGISPSSMPNLVVSQTVAAGTSISEGQVKEVTVSYYNESIIDIETENESGGEE